MRRLAACGVAAMALSGTAWAESGYLDVSHSNAQGDALGLEAESNSTAVSGAFAFGLRGRLEFQVDGQVAQFDDDAGGSATTTGGTIHVFTRDPGWMYGAFAGGVDSDTAGYSGLVSVGAEGALYFERFSVSGAVGYLKSDDLDTDGVVLNQQLHYFAHRDFRLDASLDYASLKTLGVSWDGVVYGLGGEYRIAGSPVSFFAAYSHLDVSDLDYNADQVTAGLRYNFDRDLAFRDEAGASLLSAPRFGELF
jgi:hypothetical protein